MLRILKQRAINIAKKKGHRLQHFEAVGIHSTRSTCVHCKAEVIVRAKDAVPMTGDAVATKCKEVPDGSRK